MAHVCADWPAPPGVRAVQTLRRGGVSRPPYDDFNLADHCGDDPVAVAANRRILRTELALPTEPAWLQQVHGIDAVRVSSVAAAPVCADAAWTDTPGAVCVVLTADCLPVLFATTDGSVVAAAHAGWRGLAAGVLEATVAAMPTPPDQILAWFGSAIGAAAFEVGPEVRATFLADPGAAEAFKPGRGDRWYCDLYALARVRLRRAGVNRIYGGGACTYSDAQRYYSFRRDARCGRMASLIWRENAAVATV